MFIDTHAHLNFPDFEKDLEGVIKRSVENGVEKIICVSSSVKDSQKAIEISEKFPGIVYTAVGIHPHNTDPDDKTTLAEQLKMLEKLAGHKNVVAVGECGLDYSPAPPEEKDRSTEDQLFLFEEQLKLAIRLNKPVLVHSRKAFEDTIRIIKSTITDSPQESHGLRSASACHSRGALRGIFHCYSGGKKGIAPVNETGLYNEVGFYFGIDGNLTYDEGLQNVVKEIPLEKIVLETDCPFLGPEPFRRLRNEPKNVRLIAEFLAKTISLPLKEIEEKTTANAEKVFNL